ncbi:protein kinase subdomain-containing protein PKL/ccin9 [Coprinopsis sp. MPI-PUGE-AT-0042]|nr:protein kinase subdomain-containing protein PKL/ccin9 [Coprinopsis sp. MPI-PUGE-AT-0042]
MPRLNYWTYGEPPYAIGTIDADPSEPIGELRKRIQSERRPLAHADIVKIRLVAVSIPLEGAEFQARLAAVEEHSDSRMQPWKLVEHYFQDVDRNSLHIVVFPPPPEKITLNCLISGDPFSAAFPVNIAIASTIDDLKTAIGESPSSPSRSPKSFNLFKASPGLDAPHDEPLSLTQCVCDIFKRQPKRTEAHILIVPSSTRKRAGSETTHERIKRTRLATIAPSRVGKLSFYRDLQCDSEERLYDDRPEPDDLPPLELLSRPFGVFVDDFRQTFTHSFETESLRANIGRLADQMCCTYATDEDRRWAAVPLLDEILGGLGAYTGNIVSDEGPNGGLTTVINFKNDLCGVDTMPAVEAMSFAARFHADMSHPEVFQRYRLPCLVITIVGPEVRFYGAVLLGHQYRFLSITPGISFLPNASAGWERELLYRAFAAAVTLRKNLIDQFNAAVRTPDALPTIAKGCFSLPGISRLAKYGGDGNLDFQITAPFHDRTTYRQLFVAHTCDDPDTQILVKFSKMYGLPLHEYCLRHGHAPKILAFEKLPGGWYAIAMEYLTDAVPLNNPSLKQTVMDLVLGAHEAGLVHGDLRLLNILCRGSDFWIIDFDWAGKEGEAEYPGSDLNYELRVGRTAGDLKIRREDDMRILGNTLRSIK